MKARKGLAPSDTSLAGSFARCLDTSVLGWIAEESYQAYAWRTPQNPVERARAYRVHCTVRYPSQSKRPVAGWSTF